MFAKKLPKTSRLSPHKQPKVHRIHLSIFIIAVVVIGIALSIVFLKSKEPTPFLTPSFLASGRIVYTISQSSTIPGPKITSLMLDDHNPQPKSVQQLEVTTSYDKPVDSVSIKITSDNKERTIQLVKKTGSETVWLGSWRLDDSILYKDIYTITAVSGKQTSTVITAPRS